ncbi:Purple acid phosphatase [Rhynchospora pubera]|uniref:Purple acid phosphatase n=1 Tax=Rhynchospora pubera TaxID=906938 RepID=A0AAV8EL05_9POAL|nr:Purple acid phosphatase [Rhynchospora pubera]
MGRMICSLLYLVLFISAAVFGSSSAASKRLAAEQPLSQIAIHRARMMLDSSASIHASPSVLGLQGQDTDVVTVEYSSSNASSNDWIAVFSPAKFNESICPDTSGKGQSPFLCTAPIKFQWANYSSSYLSSGKGSLQLQLINQRQDFSFALFTGGMSKPVLVAVSNTISFVNPKAPVFPRLALGKQWNEITVTWTSGYSISEAVPFVEWGKFGGAPAQTPAGTLTFSQNSMCGAPARTVGWRDPGFIHTSFLHGLWPNQMYYYKVGHQLSNGTIVWGKPYSFKAPPFPGQESLQRVVIFGDMGKAERDGSNEYSNNQPGSLNTTDTLIKDLDNIDAVFHIGDITYANGYLSQWDQFTAQIEPIASHVPYMLASGNHERDWPDSGSYYDVKDSGGECGVLAETMFYVPAENRANYWYTIDYGMFRFCIGDTEHDWTEGSEQYKFLEECFATVDRKHQPWLIFAAHRVLGYSSSSGYVAKGLTGEPNGRESLQPLWQKYRVDLTFFGHEHMYERTCPVYENQCVNTNKTQYSGTMNGTIHAVVGGGGKSLDDFSTLVPSWSLYRDVDFGFVKLTAFNHSSLLFEYKKSRDGQAYDTFTITREYKDVLACVIDSCPPKTLSS